MAFTIQVKKRTVDEDFTFSDLVLLHEECVGGKITTEFHNWYWRVTCRRCNMSDTVDATEDGTVAVCKTAIDGKRRELKKKSGTSSITTGVIVVQC